MSRRSVIALSGFIALAVVAVWGVSAAPPKPGEQMTKPARQRTPGEQIKSLEDKVAALEARIATLERRAVAGHVSASADGARFQWSPGAAANINSPHGHSFATQPLPKGWSQETFNGISVYTVPLNSSEGPHAVAVPYPAAEEPAGPAANVIDGAIIFPKTVGPASLPKSPTAKAVPPQR